ncbi:MAG: protein kinase [Acidobacteriia bacterium]|nr:protein kinase [Terriglobia bacterium]
MKDRAGSRYRILEPIGSGGMGSVFKAEDTRLKRVVALKFLPKDFTADSQAVERFEREAQAAAALDHPNICTVYEIHTQEEEKFLVMAYLEGESLDKRVEQGPLPLETAYEIARQAAEALSAAHAAGVVHRDIKSPNIMVSEDRAGKPVAKLMDFGLAQVSGASKLTRVDTRVGTTAYMSPEQALGDPVDARTDLWSLGVVLHEMVVGELPFKGHYDQAILYSILNEEPEPVTSLRSRVPMELEWIIEKCLAKAPADRYQDARELIVDIERLQRRASSGKTAFQPIEPSGKPAEQPPAEAPARRSSWTRVVVERWQSIALGAIAIAAAFAAGLALSGGDAETSRETRRFTLRPASSLGEGQAIGHAAISPDGRNIAFSTSGSGGSLWIQPLNRHEPYQVEGAEGARLVFWSPDSNFVGFTSSAGLGKFGLRGRELTMLVDESSLGVSSATWSADGQFIIYAPVGGPMLRVSSLGGAPRPLLDQAERRRGMVAGMSAVGVSEDEEVLLYSMHMSDRDVLMARRVTEGEVGPAVELTEGAEPVYSNTGHLLYRPSLMSSSVWAVKFSLGHLEVSGDALAVVQDASDLSLAADGTMVHLDNRFTSQMGLLWLDETGRTIGEIGRPQAWIVGPRLSPVGDRVLVSGGSGRDYDLWVHESDRPVLHRVTFGDANESSAIWSPDGDSVLFAQRGSSDLRLLPVGTGSPAQSLYDGDEPGLAPLDWSQDGRHILLQSRRVRGGGASAGARGQAPDQRLAPPQEKPGSGPFGRTAIKYLERTSGGEWEMHDFLPEAPFILDDAVFSPDGRYVAYESNESGDFEVYVKPFPSGEQRWQVTTEGGRLAKWSPEGSELYFISNDTLHRVRVQTNGGFAFGAAEELFAKDSFMGARRYPSYDVGTGGRFVVSGPLGDPRRAIRITQDWFPAFREP